LKSQTKTRKMLSKAKLRKIRRSDKLDKRIKKNKIEKIVTGKISFNYAGTATRIRLLILVDKTYYIATMFHRFPYERDYVSRRIDIIEYFDVLGNSTDDEEKLAPLCILKLNTCDEKEARSIMRGRHFMPDDIFQDFCKKWSVKCLDGIKVYNKFYQQSRLLYPTQIGDELNYLGNYPDGLCVDNSVKQTGHYSTRDKTTPWFDEELNYDIKQVLSCGQKNDDCDLWDLETSSNFCESYCSYDEYYNIGQDCKIELTKQLSPSTLWGDMGIVTRKLISESCLFDKFKRAIDNDDYKNGLENWESLWSHTLGILSQYLPSAIIETIIKKYCQPVRVTIDDLRKIRVRHWLSLKT
jgi:hypothetical protein